MSFGQILRSNFLNSLSKETVRVPDFYAIQRVRIENDQGIVFIVAIITFIGSIIAAVSANFLGATKFTFSSKLWCGYAVGVTAGLLLCVGAVVFLAKIAFARIDSFCKTNAFLRDNNCKFSHVDKQKNPALSLFIPSISDYVVTQKSALTHPLNPCRVVVAVIAVIVGIGALTAGAYLFAAFPSSPFSGSLATLTFSTLSSSLVFAGIASLRTHFLLVEGVSVLQMLYLSHHFLINSQKLYKERKYLNALKLKAVQEKFNKNISHIQCQLKKIENSRTLIEESLKKNRRV